MISPPWVGSDARLRWALTRAGWGKPGIERRIALVVTVEDARLIAELGKVPLAALLLPDPTRWQMFRARLYAKVGR